MTRRVRLLRDAVAMKFQSVPFNVVLAMLEIGNPVFVSGNAQDAGEEPIGILDLLDEIRSRVLDSKDTHGTIAPVRGDNVSMFLGMAWHRRKAALTARRGHP